MEILFALILSFVGNFDRPARGHIVSDAYTVRTVKVQTSTQANAASQFTTNPYRPSRGSRP